MSAFERHWYQRTMRRIQSKAVVGILLLLRITYGIPLNNPCKRDAEGFQDVHVGLIVSPLIAGATVREIEIYWNCPFYRADSDAIGLYTDVPRDDLEPIYRMTPNTPSGIVRTGFQADSLPTSNLTLKRECLKYYVAWLRDGSVKKINCLETQPNWMAERRNILGDLSLSKIFIPGTHDSGSYAHPKRGEMENLIEKYVVTQDLDVLSQLIYGVRYLDIRVGHYPDKQEKWWINHGVIRWIPLRDVVQQVRTFLDNTNEIVIFDVQEFPVGFKKNLTIHDKLVEYLEEQFSDHFLPRRYGWGSSLNEIWQSRRRLIIGYDEPTVVGRHENIWPCVTHQWGDVRTVEDLYSYLNRIETEASERPYITNPRSAMAELTPNTLDVILNRLGGLREMADRVNANVTYWYSTLWQKSANVVAVDFVRGSGIIETAIEWTERRIQCL